jgi:hypothetical protein
MMVKMDNKANWTKIKNKLDKKANNFFRNGPIVCKKWAQIRLKFFFFLNLITHSG